MIDRRMRSPIPPPRVFFFEKQIDNPLRKLRRDACVLVVAT